MTLKRAAEQIDAFRELPSGMQLRKRVKVADPPIEASALQQQIETADF